MVQRRAIEQLKADPQGFVDRYRERFGDHFNPDNAAELFPEYSASRESRANYRAAVSGPAGWVADHAFQERLAEPDHVGVLFLAGGTGSGKSTVAGPESTKGRIVFDSTFSTYGPAAQRMQEAVSSGRNVEVRYVYRDPIEAWEAAKVRTNNEGMGRVVPPSVHVNTHQGAARTIAQLAQEFASNPQVRFKYFENSTVNGIQPGTIDLTRKGDYTNLRERIDEHERQQPTSTDATQTPASGISQAQPSGTERSDRPDRDSSSRTVPDQQGTVSEGLPKPGLPQQKVTPPKGPASTEARVGDQPATETHSALHS
jgi:hypothetical protein